MLAKQLFVDLFLCKQRVNKTVAQNLYPWAIHNVNSQAKLSKPTEHWNNTSKNNDDGGDDDTCEIQGILIFIKPFHSLPHLHLTKILWGWNSYTHFTGGEKQRSGDSLSCLMTQLIYQGKRVGLSESSDFLTPRASCLSQLLSFTHLAIPVFYLCH